jgi:hypothetical protein
MLFKSFAKVGEVNAHLTMLARNGDEFPPVSASGHVFSQLNFACFTSILKCADALLELHRRMIDTGNHNVVATT